MMRTEKPRKTPRRIMITAALLAVVCFLLSWGGYRLLDRVPTFWVSKITISGTQRCDLKRIKELTAPAYGQCIFKVKLSDLYQKIRSIGWIKSLSISRVMPSTLEIQIRERVPVGIVQADQLYLVDSEGVLIDVIQEKRSATNKRSATSKRSAASKRSATSKRSAASKGEAASRDSDNTSNRLDIEDWGHLPLIAGLNLQQGNAPHPALPPSPPGEGYQVDDLCLKSALQAVSLMQDIKAQWLTEISEINVKDPDNIILYSKGARITAHEIRLGTTDNLREKLMHLQTTWSSIKTLQRSQTEMTSGSAPPAPFQKGVGGNSLGAEGAERGKGTGGQGDLGTIEYIDLRYKNQLVVKPSNG